MRSDAAARILALGLARNRPRCHAFGRKSDSLGRDPPVPHVGEQLDGRAPSRLITDKVPFSGQCLSIGIIPPPEPCIFIPPPLAVPGAVARPNTQVAQQKDFVSSRIKLR